MKTFYKQLELLKEKECVEEKIISLKNTKKKNDMIKKSNIVMFLGLSFVSILSYCFYHLHVNHISEFSGGDLDSLYINIFKEERDFIVLSAFFTIILNLISSFALIIFNFKYHDSYYNEYGKILFTICYGLLGLLSVVSFYFSNPFNGDIWFLLSFVSIYSIILFTRILFFLFKCYSKRNNKIVFSKNEFDKTINSHNKLSIELNNNIEKIINNKELITELFKTYKKEQLNSKNEIVLAENIFQKIKERTIEEEYKLEQKNNKIKMFEENVSKYCNVEMEDVCTIKND